MATKQAQCAVVTRRLGEDEITGLDHVQAEKLDQLQRTVGGDDAIGVDVLPFCKPLAQRLETARRSVKHLVPVRLEDSGRGVDQFGGQE